MGGFDGLSDAEADPNTTELSSAGLDCCPNRDMDLERPVLGWHARPGCFECILEVGGPFLRNVRGGAALENDLVMGGRDELTVESLAHARQVCDAVSRIEGSIVKSKRSTNHPMVVINLRLATCD